MQSHDISAWMSSTSQDNIFINDQQTNLSSFDTVYVPQLNNSFISDDSVLDSFNDLKDIDFYDSLSTLNSFSPFLLKRSSLDSNIAVLDESESCLQSLCYTDTTKSSDSIVSDSYYTPLQSTDISPSLSYNVCDDNYTHHNTSSISESYTSQTESVLSNNSSFISSNNNSFVCSSSNNNNSFISSSNNSSEHEEFSYTNNQFYQTQYPDNSTKILDNNSSTIENSSNLINCYTCSNDYTYEKNNYSNNSSLDDFSLPNNDYVDCLNTTTSSMNGSDSILNQTNHTINNISSFSNCSNIVEINSNEYANKTIQYLELLKQNQKLEAKQRRLNRMKILEEKRKNGGFIYGNNVRYQDRRIKALIRPRKNGKFGSY